MKVQKVQKVQKLEKLGFVHQCYPTVGSYKHSYPHKFPFSNPSDIELAKYALNKLEEAFEKDKEIHERNKPLIEINKSIREQVINTMEGFGIEKIYLETDKKSRAKYPKKITVESGYILDLYRVCSIDDEFSLSENRYNKLKEEYNKFLNESEKAIEIEKISKAKKAEEEKAKRLDYIKLASIILRYDLDIESTWEDVLYYLRSKDKYLNLAIAGLNVRSDWSNGPGEVEDALGYFYGSSDERDIEILNDYLECLENFEDGRVFRDTTWGYDRLFTLVPEQLYEDAMLAHNKV